MRFHYVRFSLCARFGFFPKKFTLCDFLSFPHFVRIFYVLFLLNFFIGLRIFCKEVNSNLLGNIIVIIARFEANKGQILKLKFSLTSRYKKDQIGFTLCEFHFVRVFKKNQNRTK